MSEQVYNIIHNKMIEAGRFQVICDTVDENGKKYPYSYICIRDCAAVLCIVDRSVLVLRQYRHTLRTWEYEIPAGTVEQGEMPINTARREVLEETGYGKIAEANTGGRILSLFLFHSIPCAFY